ncbi:MAG: hypothetical protein DRR42_21175 [Gammaproteobacteria bacterium]|nr:MAG: hypothetical protein DRR42_21175 [Gammaproteobacteria bacterium]
MKAFRFFIVATLVSLSTASIADDDAKIEAAKQAAAETCMTEALERYDSATAISEARKYNKSGMRGYYVDFKVGKNNKKVRCIAQKNGKILITSK